MELDILLTVDRRYAVFIRNETNGVRYRVVSL